MPIGGQQLPLQRPTPSVSIPPPFMKRFSAAQLLLTLVAAAAFWAVVVAACLFGGSNAFGWPADEYVLRVRLQSVLLASLIGAALAVAGVGIGYAKAGEWVKFIVDVAADGTYDFDTRLASLTGGGNFHLEVDGARVTPYLVVPKTGNWGVYTTVRQPAVTLKAGRHVLKLAFDANGGAGFVANFNWMKFTRR